MSMVFNADNVECFAFRCRKCGDKVCVCQSGGRGNTDWDAHCRSCDQSIYWYGSPEPHMAKTEYEAVAVWNWLNNTGE